MIVTISLVIGLVWVVGWAFACCAVRACTSCVRNTVSCGESVRYYDGKLQTTGVRGCSAKAAIRQICEKEHTAKYATSGTCVTLIGFAFSKKRHTIASSAIEPL